MPTGIFTQSAASILEDVDEFYFGGILDWHHGTELTSDGTAVVVTLSDPDADDFEVTVDYPLSAEKIKQAFTTAKQKRYNLCCRSDIEDEQLGYGCAMDLDVILQTACYGQIVFG